MTIGNLIVVRERNRHIPKGIAARYRHIRLKGAPGEQGNLSRTRRRYEGAVAAAVHVGRAIWVFHGSGCESRELRARRSRAKGQEQKCEKCSFHGTLSFNRDVENRRGRSDG